ncbi:MAG: hypothetical protein AB1730_28485 [Myxococcota bacterium]|jgi:hypothetical protein
MRVVAPLAVLLAAPGWATSLLLVPRTEAARPVCESLVETFTAQKLTVKMAGTKSTAIACLAKPAGERPACFLEAAKKSRVDGIVLISSQKRGAKLAVTMELLSKVTGKPHATQKVTAPAKSLKAKANQPVQRLVVEMLLEDGPAPSSDGAPLAALEDGGAEDDQLAPLPMLGAQAEPPADTPTPPADTPTPPVDTPRPPVDTPRPPEPTPVAEPEPVKPRPGDAPTVVAFTPAPQEPPVVTTTVSARGPNVAAITVTGVAVAAAAAAAIFGGMGMAGKAQLANAPNGMSPLSYRQAVDLQSSTNTNFTVALGAGIGAGVSAGVAAYLWAAR